MDLDIEGLCKRLSIRYCKVPGWDDSHAPALGIPGHADTPDVYLTCIAKIIPASFLSERIIINTHPGLLPENRGVDAFKRSIVNGWPVGVSLHVIDEVIDRGILLHRVKVPILPEDSLQDVAARTYEVEVDLLANFDYHLPQLSANRKVSDEYPLSRRRIPGELDWALESIFLKQRAKLVRLSTESESHGD